MRPLESAKNHDKKNPFVADTAASFWKAWDTCGINSVMQKYFNT